MLGSMNCCGNLYEVGNIGIVAEDCVKAAEAWGRVFDFNIPTPVDTWKIMYMLRESGAFDAHLPISRDTFMNFDNIPPTGRIGQINIAQKKYAFEIKNGQTAKSGFVGEYYRAHGLGIVYIAYNEKDNRDRMVHHLMRDYGCERTDYMKYGEGDPWRGDWTTMDTEKLLGVNLVIKNEGFSQSKSFPQMDDFDEITMIVPNVREIAKNWSNVFGVPTPKKRTFDAPFTLRGKTENASSLFAARITEGAYVLNFVQADSHPAFAAFLKKRKDGGAHNVVMGRTQEEIDEIDGVFKKEFGVGILMEYDLFGKHYTVYDSMELLGINLAVYRV